MKRLFLALLLAVFAFPTQAADRCYSAEQVKAERLLRLHSELMVITVTCKQASTGRDLVSAYTGFTKRHINALHDAESTMTGYYAAAYGGPGVDRLDKLRTKLANEYGQQIADISAPAFCAQRRDRVIAMYDSPPPSLMDEAVRVYSNDLTYDPVCGGVMKAAARGEIPQADSAQKVAAKAKKPKKKAQS